jgi:predicted PurR-regulated permease PerM
MSDRSAPVAWIWRQDRPPRWLPRAALAVAVVFLAVGLVWGVIAQLKDLFVIVLCALFIAFAIEPGVNWLAKRGWPRSLSTLTIYVLGILAFASLAYALGGLIADQVAALAKSLPSIVNSLSDFLHQHFNINLSQQLQKLQDHLGTIGTTVASNALGIGATILGSIFDLLTVALFAFYFAADGPQFRRGVCSVLPPARQIMVLQVWELAISKTAGFLYSRVLLAAVSAVCHAVFFAIIGLPYSITLGLFVGVVGQFIPTVGTYIGAALPALVALSVSPSKAVLVIIFAIIYQQIETYVLTPPLASRTMQLHPAVAFGAVIVGVTLIGPVGALLALPVTATVQAFVSSYVQRHELVESELLVDPMSKRQAAKAEAEAEAEAEESETDEPDSAGRSDESDRPADAPPAG